MRRLIWPLAAGAIALFLMMRPDPNPVPATGADLPAARPTALAVLPDDTVIVGDQGGGITVRRPDGAVDHWVAHGGPVRRVVPHGAGFSTAGDGSVADWQMDGRRLARQRLAEHALNDVLRIGDALIVGAERGSVARLGPDGWHRRGVHARSTFAVAVHADGQRLASGGADGGVAFWNLAGEGQGGFLALDGWVTGLAFTPRGLLVADSAGHITLRQTDGKVLFRASIGDRAFVRLVANATHAVAGDEKGGLWRVALETGAIEALDAPDGGGVPLSAVALTGERAWAALPDGAVMAWNVTTGLRAATLPAISDGRQR